MRLTAVVLAGGASRRMGRDKALLEVDGRRVIDLLVRRLGPRVRVASGRRRIPGLKVPQVRDPKGLEGPLAGLAAGLRASRTSWVILASCDQPPIPDALLARLWRRRRGLASAPVLDGKALPMPALYHRGALRRIRPGEGPSDLLRRIGGARVPSGAWRRSLAGWNTPAAFRRLAPRALRS